jgi:hypothetical protein
MSIGKLRLKSLDGEEQSDRDESQWIGFADARSNRNATKRKPAGTADGHKCAHFPTIQVVNDAAIVSVSKCLSPSFENC